MGKTVREKLLSQIAAIKASAKASTAKNDGAARIRLVSTCVEIEQSIESDRDARLVDVGFRLFKLQAAVHWDAFKAAVKAVEQQERASLPWSPAVPALRALAEQFPDNDNAIRYLRDQPIIGSVRIFERAQGFEFEHLETGKSSTLTEASVQSKLSKYRSESK